MKKICYIVTIPLTIRSFFISQLHYLSDNGFDVYVICNDDNELANELGAKIHFIPLNIPRGMAGFQSFRIVIKLIRIFRSYSFDFVQYSTPNAALYASIAAKFVGIRIRNYHLMGFRYLGSTGVMRKILKLIEKITCYFSTSIECASKSNVEIGISENIFKRDKATVVWNGSTGGIDLRRFDRIYREAYRNEIRDKFGLKKDDFVFGFAGRITKDKGINELLEAYYSENRIEKLLLVGPVECPEGLKDVLFERSKSDPRVIYVDFVKDIEKYYCAMDVLILPSYREGFGNVIVESAAMGTPAIVSNIPGPIDAVIKDKTAIIVEAKCVKQLARAMEKK